MPCDALDEAGVRLIWGDSMGAKSYSFLAGPVLVDPGAAAMHPSYPAPPEVKAELKARALREVLSAAAGATHVVVTHYHHDHYVRPWVEGGEYWGVYRGKTVYAKDPNAFINESQWGRARRLAEEAARALGLDGSLYCRGPQRPPGPPPGAGEWGERLAALWSRGPRLCRELRMREARLVFGDDSSFEAGGVRVRMLGPHYHGRAGERTGWVTPLLIESGGLRVVYTSDLMGPMERSYAAEIAGLRPDVVIADGPPVYMHPYRFPRRAIEEAVANAVELVRRARPRLLVYDHHLPRRRGWRSWIKPLENAARETGVELATVAECKGLEPLVD